MYHCQGCTERREWIKKWIKVGADRAKTLMGVQEVKQIAEVQDNDTKSTIEGNISDNTDGQADTSIVTTDESNGGTNTSDRPTKRRNRKPSAESISIDGSVG